jgi:predicted O-methyltransferase YrrM
MHEWHSGDYVKSWIGDYTNDERRATLRRIAYHIPHDPDDAIRVLDICGGWGPVTEVVLEAFPKAQVVLHDFSDPMLKEAGERLARYGNAVSFVRGDLMTPEWKANINGPFDAVVSSLGIHNVRFPDRIHAIYREIFPLVAPGGAFINLDQVALGEIPGAASRNAQVMVRRQQLFDETGRWQSLADVSLHTGRGERMHRHARASEDDLKRIASHEPGTLANQFRWLLDAGFDEVDCFARDRNSALIGAFRSK